MKMAHPHRWVADTPTDGLTTNLLQIGLGAFFVDCKSKLDLETVIWLNFGIEIMQPKL